MPIRSKLFYPLLAGILFLQACSVGQGPSETSSPQSTQTPMIPTLTQSVTAQPTSLGSTDPVVNCSLPEPISQPNTFPMVKLEQLGKGELQKAMYSPDGSLITIRSGTGVYFYDAETFELVQFISAKEEPRSMAFSNDGTWFALVTRSLHEGLVTVYKVATWQRICTFFFQHEPGGVVFSPDGNILAIAGWNLQLWSLPTGEKIRTISENPCWALAFSPDGKMLAGGDQLGTLKLWDVETGEEIKTLGEPRTGTDIPMPINITFSPDKTSLVVKYMPAQRFVTWNIETGEHNSQLTSEIHAISSDLTKAASFSWDSTDVFVFELKDMGPVTRTRIVTRHSDYVNDVAFSPDTTRLITVADDNTVKVWKIANGIELHTFSGFSDSTQSIALSPDQSILAIGTSRAYPGMIRLLDAKTGQEIQQLTGHEDIIFDLDFSPDGTELASASRDGTAKIWDIQTGKEIYTSEKLGLMAEVDFSPDGKLLATTAPDVVLLETLQSWEVTYTTDDSLINDCVAFSPDGETLAWGGGMFDEFGQVDLIDLATGQQLVSLQGHTNIVETISFSPDGKLIASGSWDKTVKVWDVKTGENLFTFDGDSAYVEAVSFSPDGKWLAAGLLNGTIKIWDVSTGLEIATLTGHSSVVSDIIFSPDGTRLYSSSWDGTVIVWGVQ